MKKTDFPKTVMILCGGQGTRLREVTELLPKPMVPIGEQPIVWHIMKCFAAFGVKHFILCLGYKKEAFIDYFAHYHLHTSDATITLGSEPEIEFHTRSAESGWRVTLAGTGLESLTGRRVRRAFRYVDDDEENFFLTYGDGVADIDLKKLFATHQKGGKLVTVSAVHPEARFGEMILNGSTVTGFEEKPAQGSGYVNGGFMVVSRRFLDRYLPDDRDLYLEGEPLTKCAADGMMQVYKHEGFWQCMDNKREYLMLNNLWDSGKAPWTKFWK